MTVPLRTGPGGESHPQHIDGATIDSDRELKAAAVIVGSGAGGAAMARELAEAGVDAIVVEEGRWATSREWAGLGTIDATRLLYRDQGLTASEGAPAVLMPMGRVVGGTTVINLGTILRMHPEHFELWQKAGIARLTWAELEGAYRRVEELMPVVPVAEERIGPNTKILIEGLAKLGIGGGEVLTRNAPDCRGAGRCFLGCPTDAKRAVHLDWLPHAMDRGVRLISGCRVERVLVEGGRAAGVECSVLGPNETRRHRVTIRAPRVVVAAGALLSPVLLHASGLGKSHPASGENLGVHPACRAIGLYDHPVNAHRGVPQAYHAPVTSPGEMYLETAFLPPALMGPALPGFGPAHHELMKRYDHFALTGFRVIETRRGRVKKAVAGLPQIEYSLSPRDLATVRAGLKMSARMLFDTGAQRVFVPVHGFETLEGPDDLAKLDDPRIEAADLELSGYHAHGTLRMGSDPRTAVVGEDGGYHGVPGLFVADASLFPTSSRVNPQHTVMALATLVARAVAAP